MSNCLALLYRGLRFMLHKNRETESVCGNGIYQCGVSSQFLSGYKQTGTYFKKRRTAAGALPPKSSVLLHSPA